MKFAVAALAIGGPAHAERFEVEIIATYRERDETKEPAAHRLFGVSLLYMTVLFASLIVEKLAGLPALAIWQ